MPCSDGHILATQNKIKHILSNEEYKDAAEALRTADVELDERKRCVKQPCCIRF